MSSNGTYVNGERIGKGNQVQLDDGDVVTLLKASGDPDEPVPYLFEVRARLDVSFRSVRACHSCAFV